MKNLLIKGNKALAMITGILFFGVALSNISVSTPVNYVEANQLQEVGTLSISTNIDKEEMLTAEEIEIYHTPVYTPDAKKVENIRRYLAGRNAPLAGYAEEFVRAADHYGIDYRLIAAISVIESNGGRKNFKPYNAWGWGKMTFENWEQGIWTVSKGLAGYYSRGLTTPKLIATYYCPPNAVNWANKVSYVMYEMEL
jgi:hypothetical protein